MLGGLTGRPGPGGTVGRESKSNNHGNTLLFVVGVSGHRQLYEEQERGGGGGRRRGNYLSSNKIEGRVAVSIPPYPLPLPSTTSRSVQRVCDLKCRSVGQAFRGSQPSIGR